MGEGEWFGELRSAAHGEESASGWGRICRALDQMSEAFGRGQALPYLDGALAGWSHETRRAPIRWVREASTSGSSWRLGAARALTLDHDVVESLGGFDRLDKEELHARLTERVGALFGCEDARAVAEVELPSALFTPTFDYASAPLFDGLRSLSLIGRGFGLSADMGKAGLEAFFLRELDALEHVQAEWLPFKDDRLYELLGALPGLRRLTCARRKSALGSGVLDESAKVFEFDALERLAVFWDDRAIPADALPNLQELELCVGPHSEGLKRWSGWEGWPQLTSFTLLTDISSVNWRYDDESYDAGVRASVDALVDALSRARALRRLSIQVTLHPEDLKRVLALESLSNLEVLDLDKGYSKGPVGRALFSDIAGGRALEELRLTDCGVTTGLAAKMRYPSSARRLDLSMKNKLGEKGARQVAQECEGVEVAWLERVGLGAAGGAALAGGVFGQNVRALDVSANKLGAAGLEGLFSRDWPALESLWLGMNGTGNELDADAMRVLADWDGLANLKFLSLTSERMDAEAMEALLSSPRLKNLEVLEISGNTLSQEAAEAFAASPCAPKLRALAAGFTGLIKTSAWDAFAEGDWRALELLYFTDETPRISDIERVAQSLHRFPVMRLLDGGSRVVPFLESRRRRDDHTSFGFAEDGAFSYTLASIGYRGVSGVHARSWMTPRATDTRHTWWDVVSR